MRAHRLEATVPPSGKLQLTQLPFQPGEAVEIIILALESAGNASGQVVAEVSPRVRITKRKPAKQRQRQATLTAIQGGKYAYSLAAGALLPSEAFANTKAEEKAREERRWRS